LYFVVDPRTVERLRSDQDSRNASHVELALNPSLDGVVALTFEGLPVSMVNKPSLLVIALT